jgi:16S rRNA (guanine527-N7)-methyltransferase
MSEASGGASSADSGDPLASDARVEGFLGEAFPLVARFSELLAEDGVRRGLIGPREVPRLWERHLLNSAALASVLPPSGVVVDVGSGAGLPGMVLASMRPDLTTVLVEPMLRRVGWLQEVVADLGLEVEVVRARAEELHGRLWADAVTARAVAPLDRLAGWTLPLLREGGALLAMKGDQAEDELESAREALGALGGDGGEVLELATVDGVPSTRVVRVTRVAPAIPARQQKRGSAGKGRGRREGGRRRR